MALIEVVIDTNVIIAGLRSRRGSSFQLLQLIGNGMFGINISVPLILEYHDVLLRQLPHMQLTQNDVEDFIDYFCSVGTPHEIFYLWRPTLRDPNDEMLLELAVKAQCDFIVTFNKRDFKGIDQFGLVAITPYELLEKLGVR